MSSRRAGRILAGLKAMKTKLYGEIQIDALFLDSFMEKGTMTKVNKQSIQSKVDPMDKLSALWDHIENDPCERYDILIYALKQTGQDGVVKTLTAKIPTEETPDVDEIDYILELPSVPIGEPGTDPSYIS